VSNYDRFGPGPGIALGDGQPRPIPTAGPSKEEIERSLAHNNAMTQRAVEVYAFLDRHELWPASMTQCRAELVRVQAAQRHARRARAEAEAAQHAAAAEYRRVVAAAVLAGQPITADAGTLRRAADARTDADALVEALAVVLQATTSRYDRTFETLTWAPILRAVRMTDDPAADAVADVIVWHLEQGTWRAGESRYTAAW
jgi:hypothetical protein